MTYTLELLSYNKIYNIFMKLLLNSNIIKKNKIIKYKN